MPTKITLVIGNPATPDEFEKVYADVRARALRPGGRGSVKHVARKPSASTAVALRSRCRPGRVLALLSSSSLSR